MPDAHDVDEQYVINYFVDNSVVTHADAIHAIFTCQCDAGGRAGIFGEELDRGSNALLVPTLKCGKEFRRASRHANFVSGDHFRPSSAFT